MINIIYAVLPMRAQTQCWAYFLEAPCMVLCASPKHIPACRSVLESESLLTKLDENEKVKYLFDDDDVGCRKL